MTANLSRREFVKKTAVGASAVALTATGVARGFPANEKAQIGWIGLGSRWGGLAQEMINNCPDSRTIAVCDLIPAKVERGKQTFAHDKPNGYTDMREMMDKEKLDGILVVTEPCNHAVVVVPVLEAGIHCFAEKPMDTTVEKVDQIVRAARKAKGVIYQIGTQRRYSPPHIKALEIIHSGRVGKVMFMQGYWHWCWQPGARSVARDGGFLVEQAAHHTDVMAWAMGDTAPLTCLAAGRACVPLPLGPNGNNEQQSAVTWVWPGGEIFSYTHLTYLARYFQDEKLDVHCEKAGVQVNHGVLHHIDPKFRNPDKPIEAFEERFAEDVKEDWGRGTAEELQGFIANLKAGGKLPVRANVETGRIATLMTIMGRMAMVNREKNAFEAQAVHWKDIGTTTDPV
jgi:predicted dehydrogenase